MPECSCRIPVRDTIHLYPRRSGNLRLRRACWLAEPGRPGGKQWGFGAANPLESIPAHRPALPAAISHRTLAASSSTQSQCTRERSKLKLSVPATQQPAFFPKQNPHRVACCCRECPVFNAVFPNRPTTLHQRAQASGSAKPLSEHRERINRRTAPQRAKRAHHLNPPQLRSSAVREPQRPRNPTPYRKRIASYSPTSRKLPAQHRQASAAQLIATGTSHQLPISLADNLGRTARRWQIASTACILQESAPMSWHLPPSLNVP